MPNRLPTVMSATALVVAVLGSTPAGEAAWEAVVPGNSIGTDQLKPNAVTSPKIRNGSVQAIDIQKRSITAAHVKAGSLLASSFKAGQLPAGPKGDKGDKGDPGAPGLSGYTIVQKTTTSTAGFMGASVTCPTGTRALGGGGGTQTPAAGVSVRNSFPLTGGTGWLVVVEAKTPGTGWNYVVQAVCAKVAP